MYVHSYPHLWEVVTSPIFCLLLQTLCHQQLGVRTRPWLAQFWPGPLSLSLCRREPEPVQRHQQPGAVAHPLPEKARGGGRAVPHGSAAPSHPRGRPPPAHHPDEMRGGIRLQGGVRGTTVSARYHPQKHTQRQIKSCLSVWYQALFASGWTARTHYLHLSVFTFCIAQQNCLKLSQMHFYDI